MQPNLPDVAEGLPELLAAAERFAREAGEITLGHFGGLVDAERKGDGTPVTVADREAELCVRNAVFRQFPDHGFMGEEYGEHQPEARVRWIVDPIDGTKGFMRGVPLYGVLIGVEVEGEPAVGVAHFPALTETVAAARGLGCQWNGRSASVSGTHDLEDAVVLTTSLGWAVDPDPAPGFRELARQCDFSRTWGDAYGHILVATGRADVMVDPVLRPWDAGPLLTILTEAGGRFTDLGGRATIHGGSGVSSNGHVHDQVLAMLAED